MTSLFDGKTLDGWIQIPDNSWVVKDGAMASTGAGRGVILDFKAPDAGKTGPIAWQMHNAKLLDEYKDVWIETDPKSDELITVGVDVAAIDRSRILKAAAAALLQQPLTITAFPAKLSQGGPNDFYSNGDYWWPDPTKPDGLPYVQRDGQSNPGNFSQHRLAVKTLRDSVAALAAAYQPHRRRSLRRQGRRAAPHLLPRSQDADESQL